MSSQLIGVKEAIAKTDALTIRMEGDDLRKQFGPAAKRFADRARALAPYDPKRKKGKHLRDAIFVDTRKHKEKQTDVLVGVNRRKAPHAHLIEFGWVNNPSGHPFMRPAALQVRDEVMKDVAAGVKNVVEKK